MDIYHDEINRIWRHCFHHVTNATIDIFTLVSSHNSFSLYMTLICGNHWVWQLVQLNKRLYTSLHVFLLCFESNAIQSTRMDLHDADYAVDSINVLGYNYNHFSILLRTCCPNSMQRYYFKPQTFCDNVSQLPYFIRQFFQTILYI